MQEILLWFIFIHLTAILHPPPSFRDAKWRYLLVSLNCLLDVS